MRWMLRLFPRAWRDRYGDELKELLRECDPSLREGIDVLMAAMAAHYSAMEDTMHGTFRRRITLISRSVARCSSLALFMSALALCGYLLVEYTHSGTGSLGHLLSLFAIFAGLALAFIGLAVRVHGISTMHISQQGAVTVVVGLVVTLLLAAVPGAIPSLRVMSPLALAAGAALAWAVAITGFALGTVGAARAGLLPRWIVTPFVVVSLLSVVLCVMHAASLLARWDISQIVWLTWAYKWSYVALASMLIMLSLSETRWTSRPRGLLT